MTNKRCFPQRQVRNDKPIRVARSPHHFRLQPESWGAQTLKYQQFTWKSLRLSVLRGVFRCFLRCTVSCYASLTEPVDTLCASTTSSSVVLSCRSLTLWQSMEGSGLGSDYLQIFVRLVQMVKCRYFYVWYKRLFANICTSVSGDHRHVPERRPWYVRPDHRRLRDLPCHASQLAPALSKHQKTVTIAKSLLDIPFSFLTTPNLNIWDKRTLIEAVIFDFFCFRTLIESICYQQMHDMLCFFCIIQPKSIFKSVVISHRETSLFPYLGSSQNICLTNKESLVLITMIYLLCTNCPRYMASAQALATAWTQTRRHPLWSQTLSRIWVTCQQFRSHIRATLGLNGVRWRVRLTVACGPLSLRWDQSVHIHTQGIPHIIRIRIIMVIMIMIIFTHRASRMTLMAMLNFIAGVATNVVLGIEVVWHTYWSTLASYAIV